MLLTYLITVHNEDDSLDVLLERIIKYKKNNSEIIILDDFSDNIKTLNLFEKYKKDIIIYRHKLNKDFSEHKNYGISISSGDYIFQIDADENISIPLLSNIDLIISQNNCDLYYISRINHIDGLNTDSINYYGWILQKTDLVEYNVTTFKGSEYYYLLKKYDCILSEEENNNNNNNVKLRINPLIINYPDFQSRLFKRSDNIKYFGKLHESIKGNNNYTFITENIFFLEHKKTIEKQINTNNWYNNNFTMEDNLGYALYFPIMTPLKQLTASQDKFVGALVD